MDINSVNEIISKITDDELIQISKDIYEWKYVQNRNMNVDSLVYKKWIIYKRRFGGMDNFSIHLLMEIEKRFGYLIKLLLINNPSSFIK